MYSNHFPSAGNKTFNNFNSPSSNFEKNTSNGMRIDEPSPFILTSNDSQSHFPTSSNRVPVGKSMSSSSSTDHFSGISLTKQFDDFLANKNSEKYSMYHSSQNEFNSNSSFTNLSSRSSSVSSFKNSTYPDSAEPASTLSMYKTSSQNHLYHPQSTYPKSSDSNSLRPSSSNSTNILSTHSNSNVSSYHLPTSIIKPMPISAPVAVPVHASLDLEVKMNSEKILENPIKSLYDMCSFRRLPVPVFESKIDSSKRIFPLPLYGTGVTVRGVKFFTNIVYINKKTSKEAAALLGLHSLGVPVNVDEIYNKRAPTPIKHETSISAVEPTRSGDTYFYKLQRLIQRQGLIVPPFTHECLCTVPPRHLMRFTFQNHVFEGIHSKKPDARVIAAKNAYEFLSHHPDFSQPPIEYVLLLSKYCQLKKWPSARYLDFKNTSLPPSLSPQQMHIGVCVNGYTFINSFGLEYTLAAAKRMVAKDAYDYMRSLDAVASLPPFPTTVSKLSLEY
ncbi:hypothetical protein HMI54_008346 [Coelomomyces lativittatus]|nr:hypothetical protein HMI55_005732 [Coelomomyces lativittatus]KAJ1513944.1 hypothetical protein HMI56_001458 [Coelomomyces lativittatus]KAJ1516754.1 hypothetical protein HMI54_008346 [Coelomomyces lativittatus]